MRLLMLYVMLLFSGWSDVVYANHAFYSKADVVRCNAKDLHCYASEILPFNYAGSGL